MLSTVVKAIEWLEGKERRSWPCIQHVKKGGFSTSSNQIKDCAHRAQIALISKAPLRPSEVSCK